MQLLQKRGDLVGVQPQGVGQAGGLDPDRDARPVLAEGQLDEPRQVGDDEGAHAFDVRPRDREIARRDLVAVTAQFLLQEERVERRQLVDQCHHLEIMVDRVRGRGKAADHFPPSGLADQQRAAAKAEVAGRERDNELRRALAAVAEQIGLIRPQAVLEQEGGVEDGAAEQRSFAVLGAPTVLRFHSDEIEHARCRGAPVEHREAAVGAACRARSGFDAFDGEHLTTPWLLCSPLPSGEGGRARSAWAPAIVNNAVRIGPPLAASTIFHNPGIAYCDGLTAYENQFRQSYLNIISFSWGSSWKIPNLN